ncbi:eIF4e-like protein [Glarea lozoyensis ATCC 20868]|uniref:eIF4e-like protein n=1 Tax=Glarea lozoyensis (strain ATCC 20868 / MF5171) TaxID=1116229 RepID=S3D9H5_GLAL2|nr:eIF4e-like protein [Glarea lozoyensis ATCC 20868]EPE34375.1 eIF4e-like protein [Glarea lozoyensis ATCC 20868]
MGLKRKRENSKKDIDISGYISEESEFYGSPTTIRTLHTHLNTTYLQTQPLNLNQLAQSNILTQKSRASTTLHNPYESKSYGRQLSETVPEFLARLPPRTSRAPDERFPWIIIANPYQKRNGGSSSEEAEDEDAQWSDFQQRGTSLLRELKTRKNEIEKVKRGVAKSREVNAEVQRVVREILEVAGETGCVSGKWMLFVPPESVNEIWSTIALATANNELGTAAKVAPYADDDRKERVICIYTRDFRDREDVARVVRRMRSLGVVDVSKVVWYKCDAYTYLDIKSGNEFGIKASMYGSKEFLEEKAGEKKGAGKLGGLLY